MRKHNNQESETTDCRIRYTRSIDTENIRNNVQNKYGYSV